MDNVAERYFNIKEKVLTNFEAEPRYSEISARYGRHISINAISRYMQKCEVGRGALNVNIISNRHLNPEIK